MKLSLKTIYLIGLGSMIALAVSFLFLQQRSQHLQHSLASGLFEEQYLTQVRNLQERIQNVQEKLDRNKTADLKIPEKEEPIIVQTAQTESPVSRQPVEICLSGIYLNHTLSLAEINGRLYKVGDKIGSFILEEIDRYKVQLREESGKLRSIPLNTSGKDFQ